MRYDRGTREIVRDTFKYLTGLTVLIGFFLVLIMLIQEGNYKEAVIALLGALGGALVTIVTYEFGSSSSSQRKDERPPAEEK